jgi:hypothetical protein
MRRLRALLACLSEFVVGDDPAIAVIVIVALGVTAAVAATGAAAWWVMPVAVVATLAFSLRRAAHG